MEIWVMGAGHFGRLAIKRLPEDHPGAKLTAVDLKEARGLPERVRFVKGDAADFLFTDFDERVAWIVPAVPVHLAFEWLLKELGASAGRARVPDGVVELLVARNIPSVQRTDDGSLLVSAAATTCPDDCPEPAKLCPATGEAREEDLFAMLGGMDVPGWPVHVVRSRQLSVGVGGFSPRDLLLLRESVPKRGGLLVATACRCHGVVSGLAIP